MRDEARFSRRSATLPFVLMVLEGCLLVVAMTITFKAYRGNTT